MKFIKFIPFLFMLGCSSCNDKPKPIVKEPDPVEVVEESSQETVVEGKKVKLFLSSSWENLTPTAQSIDAAAIHYQSTALLTISYQEIESYNTNSSLYDEYVLQSMRSLRNKEVSIDDYSTTTVDGVKFLLADTTFKELHVWHLFGVKDKVGYTISCGGKINTLVADICSQAIDQVKFK
jgi:hypothetical protein